MWTPKRILLLLGGFSLFLITFLVYAYFLGGIDGLPPLPAPYQPGPIGDGLSLDFKEPEADRKLQIAFGPDCPEIKRPIRVEVRSRGLGLATNEANIIQSDKRRVQLVPFSIAIFGKPKHEGDFPEINTIRSDEAFLIFDQPIENIAEIGDRKIVGAELHGQITMINNRRTPQKSDDIEVRISNGPLYYSEPESRIWSDGIIYLIDTQPQPKPTNITAIGLEIHLSKQAEAAEGPLVKKPSNKTITGVDRIKLKNEVTMHFHIDARSSFLGTPALNKEEPPPEKKLDLFPEPKSLPAKSKPSQVTIKTPGAFIYEVEKDLAIFESPLPHPDKKKKIIQGSPNDRVWVFRKNSQEQGDKVDILMEVLDHLYCDRLELQFRKKNGQMKGSRQGQEAERDIESARANVHKKGDPNYPVTLVLNTENLEAYGDELIYNSPTEERGAETILRGEGMYVIKDMHKITARELRLISANKKGEGQYAFAKGPGQIDLIDPNSESKTPLYHAVWKDSLVVTKDKENKRTFDLLTFTGEAGFIDDMHKQELHAQTLKVWLEQPERLNADQPVQPKQQKAANSPRQQPHKLEGFENVWVRSPDLNVDECDYLIVRFQNESATRIPEQLPPVAEVAPGNPAASAGSEKPVGVTLTFSPPANGLPPPPPPPPPPIVANNQPGLPGAPVDEADKTKKLRQPIDLKAKRVAVYLIRTGTKNELQEVVTEGKVHVRQEAASGKDKGVDIRGEMLHLKHHKDGDTLIVFGDANNPTNYAFLQLGDLMLKGPKVTIDQGENKALVEGDGIMALPSAANLDGTKSDKPGVKLIIGWAEAMIFDGEEAYFQGNVTAHQEEAKVRCQTLNVYLDRKVSFKEGDARGQGAKVERLVCGSGQNSPPVDIQDKKVDDKEQFLRSDRLLAKTLTMDNQDGNVTASGPGRVDLLQHGTVDMDPKNPNGAQKQLYLTRVEYQGRLHSTKTGDKGRTAKFYDNVEVYHFPANNLDIQITPEKMPKGGMYLRSDKLTVYSQPGADGKTTQLMHAQDNVYFQTNDVRGLAPKGVKYNQDSEQIIFEGWETNRAKLQRWGGPGVLLQELTGTSIIYNRRTGEFSIGGGSSIEGSSK